MTQTKAQDTNFETPPSERGVKNVLASQSKTLYLNKPKHHSEEDDAGAPAPESDTLEPSENSSEPEHDWKKRYSDLKSFHDKQVSAKDSEIALKVRELAEKEQTLSQMKQAPIKLPSTPEEIDAFKTKYAHLYNMIKTVAMEESISTRTELEKAIQNAEARTKELALEKAKAVLLELHPDAEILKKDPDFLSWYEKQVGGIKALLNSEFVDDVARGLDIYKKDVGIISKTKAQKQADKAAAAMAIPTKSMVEVGQGGAKIWKASDVKKIPMSQYHKYEAEIQKALMEGRFDENN